MMTLPKYLTHDEFTRFFAAIDSPRGKPRPLGVTLWKGEYCPVKESDQKALTTPVHDSPAAERSAYQGKTRV